MENNGDKRDGAIQQSPTNFICSGYYEYSNGFIYSRGGRGYFYELEAYSASYARSLDLYSTSLYPQSGTSKGNGFSLRCLVR